MNPEFRRIARAKENADQRFFQGNQLSIRIATHEAQRSPIEVLAEYIIFL